MSGGGQGFGGGQGDGQPGGLFGSGPSGGQGGFSGFGPATVSQMPGGGMGGKNQYGDPEGTMYAGGSPNFYGGPRGGMAPPSDGFYGGFGGGQSISGDMLRPAINVSAGQGGYGGGFGGFDGRGGFSGIQDKRASSPVLSRMPPPSNYNVYGGQPGGFSRGFGGGREISGDMLRPAINVAASNQPPPPAPAPNQGYNAAGTRFRNLSGAAQPVQAQRIQDIPMPDQGQTKGGGQPADYTRLGSQLPNTWGTSAQDTYDRNMALGQSQQWRDYYNSLPSHLRSYVAPPATGPNDATWNYLAEQQRNQYEVSSGANPWRRGMREGGIATLLRKKK